MSLVWWGNEQGRWDRAKHTATHYGSQNLRPLLAAHRKPMSPAFGRRFGDAAGVSKIRAVFWIIGQIMGHLSRAYCSTQCWGGLEELGFRFLVYVWILLIGVGPASRIVGSSLVHFGLSWFMFGSRQGRLADLKFASGICGSCSLHAGDSGFAPKLVGSCLVCAKDSWSILWLKCRLFCWGGCALFSEFRPTGKQSGAVNDRSSATVG